MTSGLLSSLRVNIGPTVIASEHSECGNPVIIDGHVASAPLHDGIV